MLLRAWPGALALLSFGLTAVAHVPARAEPDSDDAATFADMGTSIAEITTTLSSASPTSLRPVGTTAVVFKLELPGEIDAAFKPATTRHPRGHLAEIAAFRIGRALGMSNVAPAVPRTFSSTQLQAWVADRERASYDKLARELIIDPNGNVSGAAIYWIPAMREIGVDTPQGIRQWHRWLSQRYEPGPTRERSKLIAAQVSSMVAFDFLIGNWDRFSGANAQGDRSEKRLFVRDHNVAFMSPLPPVQIKRLIERLTSVERFSRSFVERLQALDEARVRAALAEPGDPEGFAPLSERQITAVCDRRKTLLSYLAALIDRFGAENVLTFP